jgi:hypothetical protein
MKPARGARLTQPFSGALIEFKDVAERYIKREYAGSRINKCVLPSWDNTARTGERATVIINGTPENYEYWLKQALEETKQRNPEGGGLLFINAWNEWAEGCHLEPDRKHGRAFLEATKRVKDGNSGANKFMHVGLPKKRDGIEVSLFGYSFRAAKRVRVKKKKASSQLTWDKIKREAMRLKGGPNSR